MKAERKTGKKIALGRIWSERWVKREREKKEREEKGDEGAKIGRSTRHRVRTLFEIIPVAERTV